MLPIIAITSCLQHTMTKANIRIFLSLVASFLCCRYEVTTRGLSRYCDYSLRHIFRFLLEEQNWLMIRLFLFRSFLYEQNQVYILAVDEVVEGKSGKHSHGLAKFYSSCAQKPIQGICFFALSLIDVSKKQSFLLHILQVLYTESDKQRIAEKKEKTKQGKERTKQNKNLPKGRKPKEVKSKEVKSKEVKSKEVKSKEVKATKENLTASFRVFKDLFVSCVGLLKKLMPEIKIAYLVADSAYAGLDYLKIAEQYNCKFISKLKSNTALYEPAIQEKDKQGRPKIYGKKIDLANIDKKYLKKTEQKDGKTHHHYQFTAYNKSIKGILLTVAVVIVIDQKGRVSTNVWFSNDTTIDYATLLQYYSLRFQIEFHFREAKQHFGFSDFKNYKERNLTNFVNLSFTMCLMTDIILERYRVQSENPKLSILDLKIIYNSQFTAKKLIKYLRLDDHNNFYSDKIAKFIPNEIINKL